jgi:hypothetical protein
MAGTVATVQGPGGLSIVDHSQYPALLPDMGIETLSEVLAENIGEGGLSLRNLVRVPMPSAGSTTWEIPNPLATDGKPEITQEIVGTWAFWQSARVYWIPTDNGELTGEPPDCSSADGKVPVPGGLYAADGENAHRNPGGKCSTCPLSRFGSSTKGSGKAPACAERKLLFINRPGELLPLYISAPPTSLDPLKAFMIPLSMKYMMHYSAFVFALALTRQEKGGQKFATLTPRLVGVLEGALSRAKGWAEPDSPAARALAFSKGFENLLGEQGIVDMAAGQAYDEASDGLGGEFEEHGDATP